MPVVTAVNAYAAVQAVVRALYARLLGPSVWATFVQAPDYDAVLGLLAKTAYAPYLELDRAILTPRRTVYQIRWHLADVYAKLIKLCPSRAKEVVTHLWHHYEVDNIKVALRGVEAGASWDQVRHLLYPMARYISVNVAMLEAVVRAPNVARAIDVLTGTPYHEILAHALERYSKEQSLFPLEAALDLGYRRALWSTIYGLSPAEREMALRTIGTALDIDNLLWAIRYRVYHHLSPEEIINYTLAVGYEVHDDDIRAIARGADILKVVLGVYPEVSERLHGVTLDSGEGLEKLEEALLLMHIRRCRALFVGEPFHIGLPLAYVWLSEYEIRDLTVVIEAKAVGVSPEVFRPLLLMPQPDGMWV